MKNVKKAVRKTVTEAWKKLCNDIYAIIAKEEDLRSKMLQVNARAGREVPAPPGPSSPQS